MSALPFLGRPSPLVYPGGVAGFDPTHIASAGIVKSKALSAVAMGGGGMVNLLNGAKATLVGTAPTINGSIGPALVFNNTNDSATFTSTSVTPSTVTIAAIVTINSLPGNFEFVLSLGGANGLMLSSNQWALWSNGNSISSGIGGSASIWSAIGVPYFVAVSGRSASTTNFVVKNLQNGAITTATVTSSAAFGANGATQVVGNFSNSSTDQLDGNIAAIMYAPTYLSMAALKEWANAPWDFWYPQTMGRLLSQSLSGPTGGPSGINGSARLATISKGAVSGAQAISGNAASATADILLRGRPNIALPTASASSGVQVSTRGVFTLSGKLSGVARAAAATVMASGAQRIAGQAVARSGSNDRASGAISIPGAALEGSRLVARGFLTGVVAVTGAISARGVLKASGAQNIAGGARGASVVQSRGLLNGIGALVGLGLARASFVARGAGALVIPAASRSGIVSRAAAAIKLFVPGASRSATVTEAKASGSQNIAGGASAAAEATGRMAGAQRIAAAARIYAASTTRGLLTSAGITYIFGAALGGAGIAARAVGAGVISGVGLVKAAVTARSARLFWPIDPAYLAVASARVLSVAAARTLSVTALARVLTLKASNMPFTQAISPIATPERVPITIDFAADLAQVSPTETIVGTPVVTLTSVSDPNASSLLFGSPNVSGGKVTQWAGPGWVSGAVYYLAILVTTSSGAKFNRYTSFTAQAG